jgi:hypothetical protein
MGGATIFLLGGALGAVLGFLISRKQTPKGRESVQPLSSPRETAPGGPSLTPWGGATAPDAVVPTAAAPVPTATAPVPQTAPVVAVAPESEIAAEPEIEEAPERVPESEVLAEPELEVAPEVAYAPEPEPVAEMPVWKAPVVEAPVLEAVPESEPMPAPEAAYTPEPEVVVPESEVAEPEVAEPEPEIAAEAPTWHVPGWEMPAAEAPTVNLPIVEEQVQAEVPMVESPDLEALLPEPEVESEVVVTPELLEEPLPGTGWEPSPALVAEEEAFDEILPVVPEEPFLYVPPLPEAAEAEGEPTQPSIQLREPQVAPIAEAAEDFDFAPDLTFEVAVEPEVEPPLVPVSADDLKARIEETRRRIRHELEQPFIAAGGVAPKEVAAPPSLEPVIGEALAREPLVEEAGEPPAEEQLVAMVEESPSPGLTPAEEIHPVSTVELGVDYDAMRSRIEATRSRLKAKAFDAMMTGESALLGRDAMETSTERPAAADVDKEIAQTIETTLREEQA